MKKALVVVSIAALAGGVFARKPASNDMPDAARPEIAAAVERAAQKAHPRLFADADGFARIKARIGTDELMKLAAEHVRAVADMMLPTPPSERIKEGKRLLTVSRTALYRIATLADLQFVESLGPDFSIRVLHSGEGTLWTDMKGASLALPARGAAKGK